VVGFDPATPERELRRILQAAGRASWTVPTASGAYVLAVAPNDAGQALRRLRAEPAVTCRAVPGRAAHSAMCGLT
jgi:hypothetical protein